MYNDDYVKLNHTTLRVDNLISVIKENVTSELSLQLFTPVVNELEQILAELVAIGKSSDARSN